MDMKIESDVDAVSFYGAVLADTGMMIDERGFLKPDGTSVFPGLVADEDARMMQRHHERAVEVLSEAGVDVVEVLAFMESIIVTRILLRDANYSPPHVIVNKVRDDETEEHQAMRRKMHLWSCFRSVCETAVPEVVFDEASGGIAVPADSSDFFLAYLDRIVSSMGDDVIHGSGYAPKDEQSIIESMRQTAREHGVEVRDDSGDIDGDDNDDDPWTGMYA